MAGTLGDFLRSGVRVRVSFIPEVQASDEQPETGASVQKQEPLAEHTASHASPGRSHTAARLWYMVM